MHNMVSCASRVQGLQGAMADFRIHGMSDELRKKLRIRAAEEDTNLNELVLRILEEVLSKPLKK